MEYNFILKRNLFKYEVEFAKKEISNFLKISNVTSTKNGFTVVTENPLAVTKLKRLTYFEKIVCGSQNVIPNINLWESSASNGHSHRQNTRYFSHGIHEYKGKFNPQVVHSLILQNNLNQQDFIYDPFSGSGTTVLESSLMGIKSLGVDINPLATLIAKSKLDAFDLDPEELLQRWKQLRKLVENQYESLSLKDDKRVTYLLKWFPRRTLKIIESIRSEVKSLPDAFRDTLLILVSNVLRDYSFQDPGDLRIRRRSDIINDMGILDRVEKNLTKYVSKLKKFRAVYDGSFQRGTAMVEDSKSYCKDNRPNFALTSPPYASALPYIDTQRLSLIWLGLARPDEISLLDSNLIGSRESHQPELRGLRDALHNNESHLPREVYYFLMKLEDSLMSSDGFRRQATPPLLYKYFSDMKKMFKTVYEYLLPGSPFLLIVGKNKTTLGGNKFIIDTPRFLGVIATEQGWGLENIQELQTYARYGINAKNSVNSEDLISLNKKE